MLEIPVTRNGNSAYNVTLDGETYNFYYRYNTRNSRIFLDISKDDILLYGGLRLIENSFPTYFYVNEEAPQGLLFLAEVLDSSIPNYATLGTVGLGLPYTLAYFTEAEISG